MYENELKQILSPVDDFYRILRFFNHLSINQIPLSHLFLTLYVLFIIWRCDHDSERYANNCFLLEFEFLNKCIVFNFELFLLDSRHIYFCYIFDFFQTLQAITPKCPIHFESRNEKVCLFSSVKRRKKRRNHNRSKLVLFKCLQTHNSAQNTLDRMLN